MKITINFRDETVSPTLSQQAQFAANDTKNDLPDTAPVVFPPKRVRVRKVSLRG